MKFLLQILFFALVAVSTVVSGHNAGMDGGSNLRAGNAASSKGQALVRGEQNGADGEPNDQQKRQLQGYDCDRKCKEEGNWRGGYGPMPCADCPSGTLCWAMEPYPSACCCF